MALTCSRGLALVRIGLGITFLMSAFEKTRGGWLTDAGPIGAFVQKAQNTAVAPYGAFLQEIVAPHAELFAHLVVLGEWVAGITLTIGLMSRLGALTAMWLNANYLLSKGPLTTDATDDRIFILCALMIAVLAADLAWSVDGALQWRVRLPAALRWLAGLSEPRGSAIRRIQREGRRGAQRSPRVA